MNGDRTHSFRRSFYVASTQLLAEGILRRAALHFRVTTHALIFTLLMGEYYFSYVASNLLVRIYILNLSAGLLMLLCAVRFRKRCNGRTINHILFWVLLICGASFFVRTPLTVVRPLPHSTAPFAQTIFWVLLQLSLALMGAVLGIVLLAVAMSDVIDRLVLERDFDSLTETLNRRAFERLALNRVADRKSYPLALIAFDIDNFKSINDRYGHAAGDAVLREFGAILREAVRRRRGGSDRRRRVRAAAAGDRRGIRVPDCRALAYRARVFALRRDRRNAARHDKCRHCTVSAG